MKLIHLSDLHLGKRVNEYSMLEDQRHILAAIVGIIKDESPDALSSRATYMTRPFPRRRRSGCSTISS